MQIETLNSYRITFKNGVIENINAKNLIEALENTSVKEADSPVVQTFMVKENIATVVETLPAEVLFTAVIADGGEGALATPSSGKIHVGDSIALKAVPADGYEFVSWSRNGEVISTEASFIYEMTELAENEDTAVFTATFALAPLAWTSEVSPDEATGAGCVAFPESGTTKIGETVSLIAVEADGYTFDHWERNGESIGTNKILTTTAEPLAEGEESAVYRAVFITE